MSGNDASVSAKNVPATTPARFEISQVNPMIDNTRSEGLTQMDPPSIAVSNGSPVARWRIYPKPTSSHAMDWLQWTSRPYGTLSACVYRIRQSPVITICRAKVIQ